MAIWLDQASDDFGQRFAAFLTTKREMSEDVNTTVRAIIDDVRARGDAALAEYSRKFEGIDFAKTPMRVTEAEIDAAVEAVPAEVLGALKVEHPGTQNQRFTFEEFHEQFKQQFGYALGA